MTVGNTARVTVFASRGTASQEASEVPSRALAPQLHANSFDLCCPPAPCSVSEAYQSFLAC